MKQYTDWQPVEAVGNYFRIYAGQLQACPMNTDGSRGDDSEACDVDERAFEPEHIAAIKRQITQT